MESDFQNQRTFFLNVKIVANVGKWMSKTKNGKWKGQVTLEGRS